MSGMRRNRFVGSFRASAGVAAGLVALVVAGCSNAKSNSDRIKEAYESSGIKQTTVYPLAGIVTVDHQPPKFKAKRTFLVVMAVDASKPDTPTIANPYVTVAGDGRFEFADGGLPPGKYVLIFTALVNAKKKGWHGPDALNNLYNDPDVNGKKTQFTIDHKEPGKSDYEIDLPVAGQEKATPGPKALTNLPG
jgi:hypothetical protein